MKRITLLVLLLSFSFVFAVMSADLGELAKKEKARREALEKAGKKAKVLTNDDVEKLKSELAIEAEPVEGESTEDTTYTPPEEGAEYVPAPEPQPQASDPAAERQKQVRELEEQKAALEKQAEEARATVGSGGLYHSRNTGDQYRKAREAEAKEEKIEKQIENIESKRQPQQQAETPREQPANEQPQAEEAPVEETPAEEQPATEEEPPLR